MNRDLIKTKYDNALIACGRLTDESSNEDYVKAFLILKKTKAAHLEAVERF